MTPPADRVTATQVESCDQFRLATAQDRASVCDTITAAFVAAASPEMTYFFGGRFAELAPVFAGQLFDKRVARQTVWVTENCDAAALWDAPANVESQPDEQGSTPVVASATLPADVQRRLNTYDDVVHKMLPPQPYWYLGILARHPDRQGSGVARRLSRLALERAARDQVPAILETTNPLNVELYKRAGWVVHAQSDELLPAMKIWVLRYDPT